MRRIVETSLHGMLALTFLASLAVAQTETAQIAGSVKDPSQGMVPGAKVALKSSGTSFTRSTTTNDRGLYTIPNLQPGRYQISIEAPGFASASQMVELSVGAKVGLDFNLQLGATGTVVQVVERSSASVDTETQTLGTLVTNKEVVDLPTLTRNPYDLVLTAGNVSESDPSNRGAGVAINGLRAASTNLMLDGVNNNDEFTATVGQSVPLDAVQEFTVLTNNFTAEYGRATGGVVNVATKSGSNGYHGTAYEFNRNSKLASNSFDNNANRIARPVFNRNQFGYSVGGPIIKNKLFFFSSTEWIRVRSAATQTAYVPTPQLLAATGADTKSFFSSFGQMRQGLVTLGTFSRNDLIAQGFDPCRGAAAGGACMALSPNMPLFQRVAYNRPSDSGGGTPQDSYLHVTRFDYILNDKTQFYGRYGLQSNSLFAGSNASSPYQGFDTGSEQFNNSALVSMVHTFSPRTVSQSKLSFDRLNNLQPLGQNPSGPTLYFLGNQTTSILGTNVALPGYLPFSPGSAIPFGGPQNFLQAQQDFTHTRGAHTFRFGGTYTYLRDNRVFGAFQESVETLGTTFGSGLDNLIKGQLFQFQGAVDPQGKFPCGAVKNAACTVQLPVSQPSFSRSNRYHDFGIYGQDSWRVSPRLTVNLGLRWEYFGIQHNKDPRLDSNFYPATGVSRFQGIRNGDVAVTEDSSVNGLTRKDWNNFAPRVGFAWDVFGDGKTSLRGGYGIGYERNFGNVTFNVIQNPPNYAVLSLVSGVDLPSIPVTTNNAGPLAGSTGSKALPSVSLRAVDPNLRTAYAHFWSASLEREVFKNILAAVEYSGSKGVDLYSIENINRVGSGNIYLGDSCTPGTTPGAPGNCLARLRTTQYSNINFRGNNGFSIYHALNVRTDIKNAFNSGVTLRANYTWSHAIDNLSSTFSESSNNLNLGLLDPFNKNLDRGNADFDQRHRVTVSAVWDIPFTHFTNHTNGLAGYVLKGWTVATIVNAHSGSPYTLFDCTNAFAVCPRAAFDSAVPTQGPTDPAAVAGQPNRFNFLDLTQFRPNSSFVNPIVNVSDFGPFPKNMTGRNAFRGPGSWNVDAALYKTTKVTERMSLQLRGEAFNIANHANLQVIGSANDVSSIGFVPAQRNGRRNVQIGAKLIF